ncbi:MAG TPA: S-layer homology domain-containing protein [Acidimicrobiia bacterium]|nr:S-layer homology domain-containing protein [Acidimicrobiia bacterium]
MIILRAPLSPARLASIVAIALSLLMGLIFVSPPPARADGAFVDEDGSAHEADIDWIAAREITRGCNPPTNDRFCPDDPVTRAQMATFLTRALDLDPSNNDSFTDDDSSSHEADIQALAATGITRGCNPPTNDRFCPDDPVTRAQMATFLHRAIDPNARSSPAHRSSALLSATCVQIVGFSQTNQWFSAGDDIFEDLVGNGGWQALIQGGGAIDRWIDPGFDGWSNPIKSQCTSRANNPDVVLFTVSGANRSVTAWVEAVEAVIDTIEIKVPSAENIILQPIVGGPNGSLCPAGGGEDVRASENHPEIDTAIEQVAAGRSDVHQSASPVVGTCSHYIDEIGHLTDDGASFVAESLGEIYADVMD